MTYDEYQPDRPPLLRTVGKYIAFFAGAALCIYLLPALWGLPAADDRISRSASRVIAVMTGSTACVFIGGLLLALGRAWSGALLMILAVVVFVVGMPDR